MKALFFKLYLIVVALAVFAKTFVISTAVKAFQGLTRYMGNTGMILYANQYSQYTYDNALLIRALAAAITATETGSVILDMGSGFCEGDLVIDYSGLDVATGDEAYTFMLEGSPDATFGTAANITVLAMQRIGGATGATPVGTADAAAGRIVLPFRNERNGTTYRYMRLYTLLAGTTPSIVFKAFLAIE